MQCLLKSKDGRYSYSTVKGGDGCPAQSLIRLVPSSRVFGLHSTRLQGLRVYVEVDLNADIQPYVSDRLDDNIAWRDEPIGWQQLRDCRTEILCIGGYLCTAQPSVLAENRWIGYIVSTDALGSREFDTIEEAKEWMLDTLFESFQDYAQTAQSVKESVSCTK